MNTTHIVRASTENIARPRFCFEIMTKLVLKGNNVGWGGLGDLYVLCDMISEKFKKQSSFANLNKLCAK